MAEAVVSWSRLRSRVINSLLVAQEVAPESTLRFGFFGLRRVQSGVTSESTAPLGIVWSTEGLQRNTRRRTGPSQLDAILTACR